MSNIIHFLVPKSVSFDDQDDDEIDQDDDDARMFLIEKSLKRMGIKTSEHMLNQLHTMLDELVHTPLVASDTFCLQQVSNDKRINELEFDFPLKPFATKQLEQLSSPALPFKIKSIQELEGIMNGKIDLFFEHNQKFYILDWKSNFLGAQIADYQIEHLSAAMEEHNYYLQYLIYTIAVCKYLSIRKKDFNYERDFGGVFYLFVRGVRKDGTTGIFFHKPDETLLDAIRLVIE